jgi:hypothetical protein
MLIENRLVSLLSPEKHCHFPATDTLVVRWSALTWKRTKTEDVNQQINHKLSAVLRRVCSRN